MSIYTRTGDKGTTGLFGGARVHKSSDTMHALGDIDELSAWLGTICTYNIRDVDRDMLSEVQRSLYNAMCIIGGAHVSTVALHKHLKVLEQTIDMHDAALPPLREFVLPSGSREAALLHIARTVCRRAERSVTQHVKTNDANEENSAGVIRYVNRLSDYLFVLARTYAVGQEEKAKKL